MLKKLQERWHVNGLHLLLILLTFAIGGSLCGYLGRKLLVLAGLEKGPLFVLCYIILITLLWPVCVLLVSVPFGQFPFFRAYLQRVWGKMTGKRRPAVPRIAIFASGAGTNARRIIEYFRKTGTAEISLLLTNNPGAGINRVAAELGVPLQLISKKDLEEPGFPDRLRKNRIDWIVLAGFLLKVPLGLVKAYPRRIVNIHPALLPLFGGRGMYGMKVHEAVLGKQERKSGITIHYVDEHYDNGDIIFRSEVDVLPGDTPETLAARVRELEHLYFPQVIESLLKSKSGVK